MTEAVELPLQVLAGLDELSRATEALVDAAAAGDAAEIRRALHRRQEAIGRLEPCVTRFRARAGAPADRRLREEAARIEARAVEAATRLEGMRQGARDELVRLVRGAAAARSYGEDPSGAHRLDRAG